jgi:hypothetical protein
MRPVWQLSSEAQCRRVLDAVACAVQAEPCAVDVGAVDVGAVEMGAVDMQTVFESGGAEAMYAQPPPAVDVESQTLLPVPPPVPAEMRPLSFLFEFVGRALRRG